jgi:hypothetical protein
MKIFLQMKAFSIKIKAFLQREKSIGFVKLTLRDFISSFKGN